MVPGVTHSYVTIDKTRDVNTEERSCNHCCSGRAASIIQGDTKKRELLKNPTKIVEIQKKKKY
jgi:hypothetical protein